MPAASTPRKDSAKDIQIFTGRVAPLMSARDHDNLELELTTATFEAAWFRTGSTVNVELAVAGRRADRAFDLAGCEDERATLTELLTAAVSELL